MEKIFYKITKEDIQHEALIRLGRELNCNELAVFEDKLSDGLGETMTFTYDAIFENFE